jgi:hypothetical protein
MEELRISLVNLIFERLAPRLGMHHHGAILEKCEGRFPTDCGSAALARRR